jgi:hypothetical protein
VNYHYKLQNKLKGLMVFLYIVALYTLLVFSGDYNSFFFSYNRLFFMVSLHVLIMVFFELTVIYLHIF